jgi:hypothetical protein
MTPQETIKYCLHGYQQAVRDKSLEDHPFTKQYHYDKARAFLEILEAVATAAGITAEQVKKIQKQVVKERHDSGSDR